jgi:hypothetical protein
VAEVQTIEEQAMNIHTMSKQRLDVAALVIAGLVLWCVAAVFLWRDLKVPPEAFLGVVAVGAAILSTRRLPERLARLGPGSLLACALIGSGWFAVTTSPLLIVPLGVTVVATAVGLARSTVEERHQRLLLWYALTVAVLATTFAAYFHLLTLRWMADDVGRRLVLSFLWLFFGVALVVRSLRKKETYGRDAGFAALAVTLGKILGYDTLQLGGPLRIALLLGAGTLLVAGGLLVARSPALSGKHPS